MRNSNNSKLEFRNRVSRIQFLCELLVVGAGCIIFYSEYQCPLAVYAANYNHQEQQHLHLWSQQICMQKTLDHHKL